MYQRGKAPHDDQPGPVPLARAGVVREQAPECPEGPGPRNCRQGFESPRFRACSLTASAPTPHTEETTDG